MNIETKIRSEGNRGIRSYIVHVLVLDGTSFEKVQRDEFDLVVLQCLWRVLGPDLCNATKLASQSSHRREAK